MTSAEAATLVVDLIHQLRTLRREIDSYRLVVVQAIHHAHELQAELARVRTRYHELMDQSRASRHRDAA